jgi:uncharacterized UPF0146 family protein
MAVKTWVELIAAKRALDAEIAAAGKSEAEVNKAAKLETAAALEAVEAKGYQQNVQTIKLLDSILRGKEPVATFKVALDEGKIKPLNKSTMDIRVDGAGTVDAVAKKYSARSAATTTASSGSAAATTFKVSSVPSGIKFANDDMESGEAAVIKAIAKIYSIDPTVVPPGANQVWSKLPTAIKWRVFITEYATKQGIEKTHAAMGSTVGANIAFADPTRPPMLLTEWLKVQLDVYSASK